MKTMEERRQELDELQQGKRESSLPRPFKSIGNLAIRLASFRDRMIPALRPLNDFGDRTMGGYIGSVEGIDRIVKVMHDHKAGRLKTEKSETSN